MVSRFIFGQDMIKSLHRVFLQGSDGTDKMTYFRKGYGRDTRTISAALFSCGTSTVS
jgi:hypothetical protein